MDTGHGRTRKKQTTAAFPRSSSRPRRGIDAYAPGPALAPEAPFAPALAITSMDTRASAGYW
jgi:hypothetical protein